MKHSWGRVEGSFPDRACQLGCGRTSRGSSGEAVESVEFIEEWGLSQTQGGKERQERELRAFVERWLYCRVVALCLDKD